MTHKEAFTLVIHSDSHKRKSNNHKNQSIKTEIKNVYNDLKIDFKSI